MRAASGVVCRYRGARRAVLLGEDLLMLGVPILGVVLQPADKVWWALTTGALLALAWNMCTLHYPREVRFDERAITFAGYGRAHVFPWSERAVSVRRFLVKDRVLVRIVPSPGPLRGRYWLIDSLVGYDALLLELQRRSEGHRAIPS